MNAPWYARKHRRKTGICPNCGTILRPEDNYCPTCGQENHSLNLPLHHLAYEFIESIFHVDTKVFNTLKAIFTRPGLITKDFVEGRRARYMPPARLYIFVSFVFFILLNQVADQAAETLGRAEASVRADSGLVTKFWRDPSEIDDRLNDLRERPVRLSPAEAQALRGQPQDTLRAVFLRRIEATLSDTLRRLGIRPDAAWQRQYDLERLRLRVRLNDDLVHLATRGDQAVLLHEQQNRNFYAFNMQLDSATVALVARSKNDRPLDSLLQANGQPTVGTAAAFKKRLLRGSSRVISGLRSDVTGTTNQLLHKMTKAFSTVMFVLMPFVAFLLLAMYYRRQRFYYEHFIFSVHLHAVLFLFASIEIVLRRLIDPDNLVVTWTLPVGLGYFLFSLKRVYGQSWGKTLLKFTLLGLLYFFVASFFLLGVVGYGFLTF